jgi:hypothetical protein
LKALCRAFGNDSFVPENDYQLEDDFITVSKYSIILTEVKSKEEDFKKRKFRYQAMQKITLASFTVLAPTEIFH